MIALISALVFILSVLVAIFVLATFWKRDKTVQKAKTNYKVFFMIGVFMVPIGVVLMIVSLLINYSGTIGFPFFLLGIVYLVIGLNGRDSWNKK